MAPLGSDITTSKTVYTKDERKYHLLISVGLGKEGISVGENLICVDAKL